MKRLIIILTLVITTLTWNACVPRYTLNGASIDYNVYKTISIGEFPIRAALVYPPLQSVFENRITDMIAQQTRLRVVDARNTDLHLEGEITNYQLSPQAVGEDAYASQTRLTITVKVRYTDNKNQALSKDLSFSAYRDFSSSELLVDVQDELCDQISKDLADLIFNATLGDW
ncbi:MAG: LptE family protein [Muribaculaceae bacterium]|nr:LptE family protein [Muribaculaceae bacterium]